MTDSKRKRTIADIERDRANLRERQDRARKDAAAADAKRREESAGEQFERSEHLALGNASAIVDSRAGAGRRAKEQREADKRAGIVRGRPPWA